MSLSRSPSPRPDGGWASPGLNTSGRSSPHVNGFALGPSSQNISWAAAKTRKSRGYPSFQSKNEGFFQRSRRKISSTLPRFNSFKDKDWRETEKLGCGRWLPRGGGRLGRLKTFVGSILRRFKFLTLILVLVGLSLWVMKATNVQGRYRRNPRLGGGSNFVIILGANEGGGVTNWKGPREWAIERDSVRNKRKYAEKWGYNLEIVDLATKKKYAHEWRESWEKVDILRRSMAKYPEAEWFWWLDLNTFIMEPTYSLQSHIFDGLSNSHVYRDINHYNPLKISHPPKSAFLDPISTSATGDNNTDSIDLIISQDCSGFNLGSFFVKRSDFIDRLLDIWWDPVLYEQKHMEWEHKEQDALEHIYADQPWVRPHVAFIEQRQINSFPPGACAKDGEGDEGLDPKIHYNQKDRDFMVNMAGCEWGRDCWAEMYQYRELSNRMNRGWRERVSDWFSETWRDRMKFFAGGEQTSGAT